MEKAKLEFWLLKKDDMLEEFYGYTEEQFCNCTGYPLELLGLRLF